MVSKIENLETTDFISSRHRYEYDTEWGIDEVMHWPRPALWQAGSGAHDAGGHTAPQGWPGSR